MTDQQHSPLGASSAERWLECSGSIALLKQLTLPESDEPDYRRHGVAAHAAAAHCLLNGNDAWELIGEQFGDGVFVDADMSQAIQMYLDVVAPMRMKAANGQGEMLVETRVSRPDIDKDMYGTLDFCYYDKPILDVTDYKHGAGIAVDVEWNKQLLYYAFMKLRDYPDCKTVRLRIVQPRAFHVDGPVREWTISPTELGQWAEEILLPGMVRARTTKEFKAGEHCRFCPAKLLCPLLVGMYKAAMEADPKVLPLLTDQSLGLEYQASKAVKFYMKALGEETFRRLMLGREVLGTKLVAKKADRILKEGGLEVLKARLGDAIYSKPEVMSVAQIEKVSPEAASLIKQWAYTPQTGLTVAFASDKKVGVTVAKVSETLGPAGLASLRDEGVDA